MYVLRERGRKCFFQYFWSSAWVQINLNSRSSSRTLFSLAFLKCPYVDLSGFWLSVNSGELAESQGACRTHKHQVKPRFSVFPGIFQQSQDLAAASFRSWLKLISLCEEKNNEINSVSLGKCWDGTSSFWEWGDFHLFWPGAIWHKSIFPKRNALLPLHHNQPSLLSSIEHFCIKWHIHLILIYLSWTF